MGLADLKDAERVQFQPCTTAKWIESLTEAQRAGLEFAIESEIPLTEVHAEAVNDGYRLRYNELRKHINHAGCSCGPR